jgi:hypothetical protein
MFTEELFTILVETNYDYQQHIQEEENKTQQPDIVTDEIYHFKTLIILFLTFCILIRHTV